ncbi:BlaI/MecI/CopY family transcriptional regulator [Tissierella pigra]|uniref:BlaI/MecI/CopY family transcriptional regulator n=1 Tax=Tissierella pigra TaxID=2607614 RepID=A0A6N7XVX4_9FIRM|nr:BlaI/MecI/CopY family transcriptional regulator [Tissierella pigra]MBU5426004.1 BlaI/MecI/CopY family transcriptional regulator [Tissierella pigra]MSU00635.1 BlaI/MecI/CopY family transcriptional regulator [Tissierella pigra]
MSKINFKLSNNEEQILETLWRENKSLTRSEIIDLTSNKTWKESSIHILLNQLLEKDAIKIDDIVRTGKSYGRTYKPTLTKDEYEIMQLKNSFKEFKPSKSALTNFFSALIESQNIENDTLEELENLIKKYKED